MDSQREREEAAGGLIHNFERPADQRPPDLPYPYISWDSWSGTAQKYVRSEKKGKWHLQTRSADLQANIDANRREQNEGRQRFKVDGETFERVARVPLFVVEMWRKQYGIDVFNKDHEKAVERLLNNPDLKFLKTTPLTI